MLSTSVRVGRELTGAEACKNNGNHEDDTSAQSEPERTLGVEDGTDLDTTEERETHVNTEDPSNGTFVVLLQLVGAEVGLINTN